MWEKYNGTHVKPELVKAVVEAVHETTENAFLEPSRASGTNASSLTSWWT